MQVHASLAEWPAAADCFRRSAEGEGDAARAARAWFGAGVAVAKQQVRADSPASPLAVSALLMWGG